MRIASILSKLALVAVLAGASLAIPAGAQTPPMRVRGEIVSLEGATLTVKPRAGANIALRLADNWSVSGIVKASLADIKPGVFIGTAAVPMPGTSLRALEVVIFPESLRGAGEGHRPWDLAPDASMTNANIVTAVDGPDGRVITVSYKDGSKTIVIGPDTPIVTYGPADTSDVKPGAHVFLTAQKQPDGSLVAARVTVGKDGVVPPM